MSPAATRDLCDLLRHCRANGYADKIVLLGGSGGASSAMAFACVHPKAIDGVIVMGMCDIFARLEFAARSEEPLLRELAALVYAAYGGPPESNPAPYRARSVLLHRERLTMPIVLSMGEKDPLIPVTETRKVADALSANARFRYIEIPGGNHDSAVWICVDLQRLDVLDPPYVSAASRS